MMSPFEEVTDAERKEIAMRLYRAQCHFENQRNTKLKDKAKNLDEKFGGLQANVTRYDLNAANEFLTEYGFGPDKATASSNDDDDWNNDWNNDWISISDGLPTIPEKATEVPVEVKYLVDGEVVELKALFVNKQSGYNTSEAPCFVMLGRKLDRLNMSGDAPLIAEIIQPTHWRARTV